MNQQLPSDALALADELRGALRQLVRRLRQESSEDANRLSLQQRMLLSTLDQHPGVGVAELARLEKVRGPTMSGHIKALEQAGLVERGAPDPADRRRSGLLLSPQGRAVLDDIRQRRRDWLAAQLAQLPDEGRTVLRQAVHYLQELGQ